MPDHALIALGANLPAADRCPAQTVVEAMQALRVLAEGSPRCSSLWRSRPVGCPAGSPDFINAAVALQPAGRPGALQLLDKLQALEREFGRVAGAGRNAPRVLDLDLIAWGDRRCARARLALPHPRASQRAFVLLPLAELVPEQVLPGQQYTIAELAEQCPDRDDVFRV